MSNTAPVENAQSSEASQATIAATSSTSTKRAFGIFDIMKSICCCVIWSKIAVFAAAVVLLQHGRHDRLAADEGAVEVDAQHLTPFLEIGLPHRFVDACDAGIVDEDVDLAERV